MYHFCSAHNRSLIKTEKKHRVILTLRGLIGWWDCVFYNNAEGLCLSQSACCRLHSRILKCMKSCRLKWWRFDTQLSWNSNHVEIEKTLSAIDSWVKDFPKAASRRDVLEEWENLANYFRVSLSAAQMSIHQFLTDVISVRKQFSPFRLHINGSSRDQSFGWL